MTTNEYAQLILEVQKELAALKPVDETAACEAAQLISGSFTYTLYEALWENFFDMEAITQRLENLYDGGDHCGFAYFIFILANAVDFIVPVQFSEMSANDGLVPFLSAAIIEDWLDYDASCEPTEYED